MNTRNVNASTFRFSVVAAPPLARNGDFSLNPDENRRIIRYLEEGGVNTLLYGANANFHHIGLGEYAGILEFLEETVAANTLVIPSIGPAFGTMIAQARALKRTPFPVVAVLPASFAATSEGTERGIRRLIDVLGKPVILEVDRPDGLGVSDAHRLVRDGLVAAIVYSMLPGDPASDAYLEQLVDRIDPTLLVSGCGEEAAIAHMGARGMATFVSHCACVAPRLSRKMHRAIQDEDLDIAENIRELFAPFLRQVARFGPERVVHEAVQLARIADTGTILPFLSNLEREHLDDVRNAIQQLMVDSVNFGV